MKEEYLHYLWRMKRLNFNELKLINSNKSKVHVKETGWYNTDAGPDFFNGTVVIDGIQWSGNIEIHIKSSDWYAHQHQFDPAFNNVVLHVVYEFDKEVYINGVAVPTVELKSQIDTAHYHNYRSILQSKEAIACRKEIHRFPLELTQQIDIAFVQRIERKGLALINSIEAVGNDQITLLFLAIFKAVGGRVNHYPMEELATILPYQIIMKEKWDPIRVDAILFGCAGLLNISAEDAYVLTLKQQWSLLKNKHQLPEMNPASWKFNGVRPYSFPTYVLAQLSALLQQINYAGVDGLPSEKIIQLVMSLNPTHIHPYWHSHLVFGKPTKRKSNGFSTLFKRNLLINGFAPFLAAMKYLKNDFAFADKVMELLEAIPPEENRVTKKWKEIGIHPKNALESQALIELYNEFCIFRKCLSCKIGSRALESK